MTKPGPKPRTIAERFWPFVDKDGPIPPHRPELGPCWVFKGYIGRDGYGQFNLGGKRGKRRGAHRVAWFLAEGRWPDPNALHHCDNQQCVRRAHLFEGSVADNNEDMVRKGRQKPSRLSAAARAELRAMRARGATWTELARTFGVCRKGAVYICTKGRD